jgi:hypothetical protein
MARQEGALEKRGLLLKQVLAVVIIVLLDLDRAMQLVRQKKRNDDEEWSKDTYYGNRF